jgi:uncharacterized LabA/DUF88 family protein
MLFYPTERLGLFVDGPNLQMAMRGLGWDIDYTRLREYFAKQTYLVRAHWYTAVSDGNQEYISLRPLIDFLDYNGWHVVTKAIKEITDHGTGSVVRKGNMDIEIAIDMMKLAPTMDHLILFSGDGDFRRLVEALQDMGKRVSVCSTREGNERCLADELRRQADNFIELVTLKLHVARDAQARTSAAIVTTRPPARAQVARA